VSLPGLLVYGALRFFVLGHSRPLPELFIVIAANLLNAAGDWALIGGHAGFPALGVRGCAISTAVFQTAMLAAMAGVVLFDRRLRETARAREAGGGGEIAGLARHGLPVAAQEALRYGFLTILFGILAGIGREALAASQIVFSLGVLAQSVPAGMSIAVGLRVSRGAKTDRRGTRPTLLAGYLLGGLFAAAVSLVYLAAGPWIASRYGDDPAVIAQTVSVLHAWALFQLALAFTVLGANALFGLLDVKFLSAATIAVLYAIGLPLAWLLGRALALGPAAVWLGPFAAQAVLGALFFARFWRLSAANPAPAAAR
jgi:MATE family multidrug resistance protein